MDLHPPPKPGLWVPPRPAIIRATDVPKSPAAARGIGHNGGPAWLEEEKRHREAMLMLSQLNGFGSRRRSSIITVAFLTSANATSGATINVPGTALAGDFGVVFQLSRSTASTIPTLVNPSGWQNDSTGTATIGTNGYRSMISSKILVSGDVGATLTGMNGNSFNDKFILIFRGSSAFTSYTATGPNAETTANAPTAQALNASTETPPMVLLAFADSATSVTFSGTMSTSGTPVTTGSAWLAAIYELFNSSPADRTIGVADSGTYNSLSSIIYELV